MITLKTLNIGSVAIELRGTDANDFLGIGKVSVGAVQLRASNRLMVVRLDTPDGIIYPRFEFLGVDQNSDGSVRVRLRAQGMHWGRGEYGDDYDQSIVWLTDPNEVVSDDLALILTPLTRQIAGRDWKGFSYAFEFKSHARSIHRLLVLGTWEIDGSIIGNTVLSQGQCNMPVYRGTKENLFTTACLKTLNQYGSLQGNSFQLGPRGGLIQGFDLQHSKSGALLQYWPQLNSVSSLIESPIGSDLLHVIDEYRFTMSEHVTTDVSFEPDRIPHRKRSASCD
jgi:hypothetical protein